ncbi:hypothetical protein LTR37_017405 [Vermiconidia calcicola]|uniref:Uncharacterized protein n=1 Tax=Vermiconidia calcicola TaxID=1690605 RepID=A0ACC3MK63_9PEZI|nr:hypothetical protein LTR37_017405 [Vermiconidia calcicola]
MRTLLLPIGPPGAGKSTLCNGLQQFMNAINRPCSAANLDPANDNIPYEAAFDVRELVNVEEVMEREELGPNGGVLWAMEEIEENFDWLEERLDECEETILLDPPGQPELTIHHMALPRILQRLEKLGYRIVVIQLLDSVILTRPSLYLSSLLLCLRGMLHLPYSVVNVLTKIDNLEAVGGAALPFNLDFYTEVQDLQQLLPVLSAEQASSVGGSAKWEKLNSALIELVEDFGLVGFETLAVEDRQSMASLLRAVDRASGYVFAGARGTDEQGRTLNDEASIWAQAMSERWAGKMEVRDVQERWIDRKEEFDEMERRGWVEEARLAGALPENGPAAAVRQTADGSADSVADGEDDLLAEQRKWEAERAKGGGGGPKVLSEDYDIIRPTLEERQRPAFIDALKTGRWGDFAAIMRPFFSSGGEMGRWNHELISLLPASAKVFASAGAGHDWVDVKVLADHGIVYCNGATASSEAVADMALWHILSVFRNITWSALAARSLNPDAFAEAHKYVSETAHNPRGHIVGIIGMGNIGFTIARKAYAAFGVRVYYHDLVRKSAEQEQAVEATYCHTLEGLVSIADCIVLATPFGGDKLITAEMLKSFKQGSRFVNVARGMLVDEEALADSLESGHLFAAGLDVHLEEPHVNARLGKMVNVSVTCHNAGGAVETRIGFERLAIENVQRVLKGQDPLTPVNLHLMG